MNYSRIYWAIAFVLAVIGIAWALYFFIFRPLVAPPADNVNGNIGTLPPITNGNIPIATPTSTPTFPLPTDQNKIDEFALGGLTKVTDETKVTISQPQVANGQVSFYDAVNSQFGRLSADGTVVPLSDQKFYNVEKVTWATNKAQAIIEYPDGSNIYYDFNTRKQVTLPKELEKFALNSTGTQFSAVWESGNPDNNWLMTGNVDGSNLKIIEPVGDKKSDVQVTMSPDNQVVALFRKASDIGSQSVYPIGQNQENFSSFTVDGLKFESKWSEGGSKLLYNASSAGDDYNPRLWLTDASTGRLGESQTNLQVNTWADKCAFGSGDSSIYCAVPSYLPRGAGLYPELAKGIPDLFYRIDLNSGVRVPLAIPIGSKESYSAQNLFLSPDGSILYFVDSTDNRLHSIRLK